jgi:uncharacterized membrane protein
MRTTAPTRMSLQFAATLVACAIFCLATTVSAQQPAAKMQNYTEVTDGSAAAGLDIYRWLQSGGKEVLTEGYNAHAVAVSGDGEVAVISRQTSSKGNDWQIFIWSKAGGLVHIADVPSKHNGFHFLVSGDDSSVIWVDAVRSKKFGTPSRLLRWSKAGGLKDLAVMAGAFWPKGVSSDGSVIVGTAEDTRSYHGFRWTQQGGLQEFSSIDDPLGISADGTVILGIKGDHVIRWTQQGGAQDLGTLRTDGIAANPKWTVTPHPFGASVNGTVIVGWLSTWPEINQIIPGDRAFLWTQADGLQDLGTLRGKSAHLNSISPDGAVVVGDYVDTSGSTVQFVSPVADLVAPMLAKKQAKLKEAQACNQAQAAAQEAENAKNAAIEADQQARYDRVVNTGRPIQIYSLAGDLQDEGRPDLAANLYQLLIDKYPDDPYAAKAVDMKDAARAAAAQQQAQDAVAQPATANAPSPQAVEACLQQCSSTLNSCKSDAQNQHANAVAKGLVGLLSKNSASVSGAASDVQDADSAQSACEDAYNTCSTACQ